MKILVIFSGLIRGNPQKEIDNMKYILPEADILCVSWKRNRDFDLPIKLDKEYDEPIQHYWPEFEKRGMNKSIARIREYKEKNPWPPTEEEFNSTEFKTIRSSMDLIFKYRLRQKNRAKQQLIHALACRDFMDGYDIVIRSRYDAKFSGDRDFFRMSVDLCYDKGIPIGYGAVAGYDDKIQPYLEEDSAHLADFIVIHTTRNYDPNRTIQLFKDKKLHGAEAGWAQSMMLSNHEGNLYGPLYHVTKDVRIVGGDYHEGRFLEKKLYNFREE